MQGLDIYSTDIAPEWIDYNGHLRDAYYSLVLSYACDALMDYLGMDEHYRHSTQGTLYSLEQHLHFLHEVKQSDRLIVRARLLAADRKRLHVAFDLYCARHSGPVACAEQMLLHVRQGDTPAAAAFPAAINANIDALLAATAALPASVPTSRRLELRR